MDIIGRTSEIQELEKHYYSNKPELVIVYGRRRVGKTYLIKELFKNKFAFYFTGTVNVKKATNLANFDKAIKEFGGDIKASSKTWSEAFDKLKILLKRNTNEKKVIFIDEMPWLDTRNSDFLAAFDYFWNSWASSNPEILFIGCGSATSWITKNFFKNRGGLHNRVTKRIHLAPFTIGECEDFFKTRNIVITRYQLAECYMIFGGIPYYLDLFDKSLSFSQNVDKICFSDNAPLRYEFDELYMSLFNNSHRHIKIVEILSTKKGGMSRNDICEAGNIPPNGHITTVLSELEQCNFIEKYTDFTRKKKNSYYLLKDPFTLFYLRFMKNNNTKDEYFWTNYADDSGHRTWCGHAFELLCRMHLHKIKEKLGIPGVSTEVASWHSKNSKPGAQIDLLISRKDGVINLCEMKYSKHPYEITKSEADALERRKMVFIMETGTKYAIHITMVTTFGLAKKGYFGIAQSEVTADDLF
ncbi:MAG: ATP-binding protein [Oscillospiraceae bacterium]|nr:ATP-binding protein [Oscillospiraceae bacterium]